MMLRQTIWWGSPQERDHEMAVEPRRMQFDEFASNLRTVFEGLTREHGAIIVAKEGQLYRVEAEEVEPSIWDNYDPERARQALHASRGALRGVDREQLLADIHAQRTQDSHGRPTC